MPTQIDSAGITFNDTTSLTSANIGTAQLVNGSVIASKLGTTEQKQICKAWVNFDGTNAFSPNPSTTAIRSSYNVSSVTKNGTGDYTINFATPMADANYSVSGCAQSADTASPQRGIAVDLHTTATTTTPLTTTSARFRSIALNSNPQPADSPILTISIFGN